MPRQSDIPVSLATEALANEQADEWGGRLERRWPPIHEDPAWVAKARAAVSLAYTGTWADDWTSQGVCIVTLDLLPERFVGHGDYDDPKDQVVAFASATLRALCAAVDAGAIGGGS